MPASPCEPIQGETVFGPGQVDPEIHHGAAKQGVDVANSSMIFRQYRDKQLFPSLELAVNLRPGQVMVVGTTPGADQLGHLFLSEPEGVEEKRGKLVLVRLAQVQLDDLFEQTQSFLPLETPVSDLAEVRARRFSLRLPRQLDIFTRPGL
ncbi:MAG: hypothetical protein R3B96_05625 [Pirellulaceae bacterium]